MKLSTSRLLPAITLGFATLISAAVLPTTALAVPTVETSPGSHNLVKRYQGSPSGKIGTTGPNSSDYPSDSDIQNAYIPPSGPFVFFSNLQDSQAPYQLTQTSDVPPGATILRGVFPPGYVTRGKPRRSVEWFQDFLDRISGFYSDQAVAAGNRVYFVGQSDALVKSCSIWSRIELPTLRAAGIPITLVDYQNFESQVDYPSESFANSTIGTRDQGYCPDWEGDSDGDDPADPDD